MKRLPFPFIAVLLFSTVPCSRAYAEISSLCSASDSEHYLTKASGQFARGIVNMGLCWVELVHQPSLELQPEQGGNLFRGLARGVGHTVLRAGKGISDIFFCLSPPNTDGTYNLIAKDCAFGILGLEER